MNVVFGWYGTRPLTHAECFAPTSTPVSSADALNFATDFSPQTSNLAQQRLFVRFGPTKLVRESIASCQPPAGIRANSAMPRYSIITPYHGEFEYFQRCATGLSKLIAKDQSKVSTRIEWIVLNDDPTMTSRSLEAALPDDLKTKMKMVSDGKQKGPVARFNEGVQMAVNDWIVFLDGRDLIGTNSIAALDHYVGSFQKCRCILSRTIDIDANNREIGSHKLEDDPSYFYERGMMGAHLAAVRRDLMVELGAFDPRCCGCEDLDFVLRTMIREPILLVSDRLYCRRVSAQPQSIAQLEYKARNTNFARKRFLSQFIGERWPAEKRIPASTPGIERFERGICLVRTQGQRFELLAEAIRSIVQQAVPVTPCVIVHGNKATFEMVEHSVSRLGLPVLLLHADKPGRLRGYPFNVALDYLCDHADQFDFICILDDDDIYYPLFAERMTQALTLSRADVVFALTNQREFGWAARAGWQPRPVACLVGGNFIPTNSFIVRVKTLISNGVRFREDLDYLEDWDFLISLMLAGANFHLVPETLSEFRIISDGNRPIKRDPKHYEICRRRVTVRGRLAARLLGLPAFYRSLLDFGFDRVDYAEDEFIHDLSRVQWMFEHEDSRCDG
jgi:cellulose synthase/poly-beta-1,6-N-acetylglucosamine synthase-like glycosyltransferase